MRKEENTTTAFSAIQTPKDLICYLDDSTRRLENSTYLYHYTTISRAVDIIQNRAWHLGNAAGMNDKMEFKNGDPNRWKNLFFSCFMCEDKESIGMWSMYAQPWESGVKIAIPKQAVRAWIKRTKNLLEISTQNYKPTGRMIPIDKNSASLRLSSVAYSNADSMQVKKEREKLSWSNQNNTNIRDAVRIPELTGYIKDIAWSYEKEIRIKAEFENVHNVKRVAIPLDDELIEAMTITASPLFDGDLEQELSKEINIHLNTEKSIFTGRLNITTPCQKCDYKKIG